YAGKAIARKIRGKKALPPFKYFDKGSLAVIGRAAAVADVFGLHISGLLAWLVWAFIHLMYLVQFQSRILVFIQWAIQDVTFNRGSRLITGSAATDFNFEREIATAQGAGADGSPSPSANTTAPAARAGPTRVAGAHQEAAAGVGSGE